MSEQQEKKNKTIAMITSVGIHGLLLLAFMLMMAWRAPNPPLPEYGIELNPARDGSRGATSRR
jgi:protein TonB